MSSQSLAEQVAMLSEEERLELFKGYSEEQFKELQYDANFWLRPSQKIPDGDWFITALVAGRGFGKTYAESQWVRRKALENPGCRIAIAGRTVGDVRRIMVHGESGILAIHAPHERPEYKPSTATLIWPNGSTADLHSSESPDSARGPQYHYTLGDEFAAWKTDVDSSGATLISNLIMATRLGDNPQIVLGTTPKRTIAMKDIMKRSKDPIERIRIISGSTYENSSLSKNYIQNLKNQYAGSKLAEQELDGKMLEDAEGLIFTDSMINNALMKPDESLPDLPLRIIGVDPSVSADPAKADECGIFAMGATNERDLTQRKAYVMEDASIRAAPDVWAQVVVDTAKRHRTKHVVVERNQGGALLQMVINAKDPSLKVHTVFSTQSKVRRVEPLVVIMEQGRIRFTEEFPELADQLLFFDPDNSGYSPDRMDAFGFAAHALLVAQPDGFRAGYYKTVSAAHRKLPTGLGAGRVRATGSIRSRRR